MLKYSIRRLAYSAIILFLVMFIIYSLMYAMPASYVNRKAIELSDKLSTKTQQDVSSDQLVEDLYNQYGIDKSLIGGYLTWLGSAVKFDFGTSWNFAKACTQVFHEKIWYTFRLNIFTMFFVVLIAVPLGVQAARNQYGYADYSASVFSMISISLPSFFVIILLKYVFAVKLGWLPLSGMGNAREELSGISKLFDSIGHMILPVASLTLAQIGSIMRYTRTNMLEVLSSDYIRTARAKGVPERIVIYSHAFRNTMIPLITILSTSLVGLFYGSIVTEQLFALDGIGKASFDAMMYGDIPFTMFYLMFIALLTLIGNLIADLLYAAADPRVRLS